MNTAMIDRMTASANESQQPSALRRIFGVVTDADSYRSIAYLLLGLPLGTIWFTVLVTGISLGISLLIVALLGIPVLLGMWYVTRAFGNVERATANALLDQHLPQAPLAAHRRGNVWVRLRSISRERDRWRELAFVVLRFPAGVATFTVAVTALATPVAVAYAPITARHGGDQPFGTWSQSSRIDDIASNPWAWLLIPLGIAMLLASMHLLKALASACGRWTTSWLAIGND